MNDDAITRSQRPRRRQMITAKEYGPDPVDVHVGFRLRLRRTLLGLSQEQLAAAVGVTFQQIQKYERGSNRVSASRLYDIARAMGVSISFFFADITDNVTKGRPTQNLSEKMGLSEQGATAYEQDPLARNETLELVRCYWKLPSKTARVNLLEFLRVMAH